VGVDVEVAFQQAKRTLAAAVELCCRAIVVEEDGLPRDDFPVGSSVGFAICQR